MQKKSKPPFGTFVQGEFFMSFDDKIMKALGAANDETAHNFSYFIKKHMFG